MRIKVSSLQKLLFCLSFFVMFFSRIELLTGNYTWNFNAVLLEGIYLIMVLLLIISKRLGRIGHLDRSVALFFLIFFAHTILWGKIFVNPVMSQLTASHFSSQIIFVLILFITVIGVLELDAKEQFIKVGYYTLVFALLIQLFTHFQEFNFSNVANIMSSTARSRANFGFGHYNTLGGACVCALLIYYVYIRENTRNMIIRMLHVVFNVLVFGMLLCSASRSSITSLGVFIFVYAYSGIDNMKISKKMKQVIKFSGTLLIVAGVFWTMLDIDLNKVLIESQRFWIFQTAIPEYLRSGRLAFGLGYASTTAYGTGMTPYHTLWIDNAYFFHLITTGILGFCLIILMLVILGKGLRKADLVGTNNGNIAIFAVYLYSSLFEVVAFNGAFINYIYLPLFLVVIALSNKIQMTIH